MPKSVKFHETFKQEVDLVKSIPQGGLGAASKCADESQAWPLPGAWPARQRAGVGLPAAPAVRKINPEVNSKGKGLFYLLLSRVDYFQHKPTADHHKVTGIFPQAMSFALKTDGGGGCVRLPGGISGKAGFR